MNIELDNLSPERAKDVGSNQLLPSHSARPSPAELKRLREL